MKPICVTSGSNWIRGSVGPDQLFFLSFGETRFFKDDIGLRTTVAWRGKHSSTLSGGLRLLHDGYGIAMQGDWRDLPDPGHRDLEITCFWEVGPGKVEAISAREALDAQRDWYRVTGFDGLRLALKGSHGENVATFAHVWKDRDIKRGVDGWIEASEAVPAEVLALFALAGCKAAALQLP